MLEANSTYHSLLNKQSKTLGQARREYTRRYSSSPPKGFDKWYAYAKEQKSLIIDDFDVINDKLKPFRQYLKGDCGMEKMDPAFLGAEMLLQICVKDGILSYNSDEEAGWIRDAFRDMINPFLKELPNMCFLMNLLDEPRTLLATDRIAQDPKDDFCPRPTFVSFEKQKWWSEAVLPCSPKSPARLHPGLVDPARKGRLLDDFKSASDLCDYSEPMEHGIFISPSSLFVTRSVVPIMSNAGECLGDFHGPY
jgi:hypothetical protein